MTNDNNERRETGSINDIGATLRKARKQQKLTLEEAAAKLRLPCSTLELLESGRLEQLGPPVYVRGYLGNYARLLGIDMPQLQAGDGDRVVDMDDPPLVNLRTMPGRGRRAVEQYARLASYLVATVVVVLPILWWGGTGLLDSIGVGNDAALSQAQPDVSGNDKADTAATSTPASSSERPLLASMTPRPSVTSQLPAEPALAVESDSHADEQQPGLEEQPPMPGQVVIELSLAGDSWVELVAADGEKLEFDLVPEGSDRRYVGTAPVTVLFGNAAAVEMRVDGEDFDTKPHRQGNLARFEVNASDEAIDDPSNT